MAGKIKEQFKHTSAKTVASNSDLGKRQRQRAAWGDAVGASLLHCWELGSQPQQRQRCKLSYFFWILQSGWKRTLEEAQGSWDKKPQSCSQTGCRMCCPKWGDRWKPGDYCSSWVTPLGYSKAAFHMLRAKPPHTKAESKTLKGVHHPQTPLWWFPSLHSLRMMESLLNSVTQDSRTPYIGRPYIHFLTCNF